MTEGSRDLELQVQVLNKTFTVKCPPEQHEALTQAATFLNNRLTHHSGQSANSERIILVTALNLAHELLQQNRNNQQQMALMNNKIIELKGKITDSLAGQQVLEITD